MREKNSLRCRRIVRATTRFTLAFLIGILANTFIAASTSFAQEGSLQVVVNPTEAVNIGAQWRVDDGPWMNPGDTAEGLTTHRGEIAFKDIAGWQTPKPVKIWLFNGLIRNATATYYPLASHAVEEIPSLQAFEGETLQFRIFSQGLGDSAALSATGLPAGASFRSGDRRIRLRSRQ